MGKKRLKGEEDRGRGKKRKKQTRDTCGERRSGLRLKPHKKNNFAVGEEIREREESEVFFFWIEMRRGKNIPNPIKPFLFNCPSHFPHLTAPFCLCLSHTIHNSF